MGGLINNMFLLTLKGACAIMKNKRSVHFCIGKKEYAL